MAPREGDLLRLTLTAHEAASDASLWPKFLADYARIVDAEMTMIQRHYFSEHRSHTVATFGMTRQLTDSYNKYYSRLNVWRENGSHLYVAGRTVIDPEMYPRPLLKRSEFYNDCLLPNGGTHSLAGVIARRGPHAITLTALRHDRRTGWQEAERPVIEAILPHLARAHQTIEHLQLLEAGHVALNALNLAALLIDAHGKVIFHNDRAERTILQTRDGLAVDDGKLHAQDSAADAALQRLIAYAMAPGQSLEPPSDVLVPRSLSPRPYHVTIVLLRREFKPFIAIARPVALVLVTDPDHRRPVGADALRIGYRLTRKEASLAVALAKGLSLEDAAGHLGMRYETARTHLRRIFSKTQTSRQTELMTLLAKLFV